MSFLKDVSITGAGNDLISYLRVKRKYNLLLWLAACVPFALTVYMFNRDSIESSTPPDPGVFYFESWPASRSMEDIKRDQAIRAEQDRLEEARKREAYRALGRAAGMDVEALERDAEEMRAESEKRKAEREAGKARQEAQPEAAGGAAQ